MCENKVRTSPGSPSEALVDLAGARAGGLGSALHSGLECHGGGVKGRPAPHTPACTLGLSLCFCCLCSSLHTLLGHSHSTHHLNDPSDPKQTVGAPSHSPWGGPALHKRPVCESAQNTHGPIHRPLRLSASDSFTVAQAGVVKATKQVFGTKLSSCGHRCSLPGL